MSSLKTINNLNIKGEFINFLSKNEIIEKFKTVFEGPGTFPGDPYSFSLRENAVPCVFPAWRIPKA